jgi:hypothetical protein
MFPYPLVAANRPAMRQKRIAISLQNPRVGALVVT